MSERKILMSGPLKGLVTANPDQPYQGLETFRKCWNARPESGSLVMDLSKNRNSDVYMDMTGDTGGHRGPTWIGTPKGSNDIIIIGYDYGILQWTRLIIDNSDYPNYKYFITNPATFWTPTNIGAALPAPTYLSDNAGYSRVERFTDASDNDLLFYNRKQGAQPFYVDLVAKTRTVMADAFLADCSRFIANQNTLFAAVGNKIYYSAVNDGTTWVSTDFERLDEAGEEIVDMYVVNSIVIIFTTSNIYTMTGNDSSSIEIKKLSSIGIPSNSGVDGDSNSCYFFDTNGNYKRVSGNPHYFGIQSIEDIGAPKISTSYVYDSNSVAINKTIATGVRVIATSDYVFFGDYPGLVYCINEDAWFQGYNWVDVSVPAAISGPLFTDGYATTNNMNIPYKNVFVNWSNNGLTWRMICDRDTSTLKAQTKFPYNGKPFNIASNYSNFGTDNFKILNKVYLDFNLPDGDEIDITISVRGDNQELLVDAIIPASSPEEYYTYTMTRSGWITIPPNCRSRKFSVSIHCNSNTGFKLNGWGVDFTDLGQGAY